MRPVNIPGYETYHVSEEGVVINTLTNKVLKTDLNSSGYKRVTLCVDMKVIRITTHRLVALTYLYDEYLEGLVVNHKDGNKLNNHVSNLEWVTQSQNRKHAFKHKLVRRPNSKLNDQTVEAICVCIEKGMKAKDITKAFDIKKHIYDDIRSRRYYKDISDKYNW